MREITLVKIHDQQHAKVMMDINLLITLLLYNNLTKGLLSIDLDFLNYAF